MKQIQKIICVILILSLLTSFVTVFAATGTVSSNTGRRHTTCVSLSKQAQKYYTDTYTWENLSSLAGVYAPDDSYVATQDNPLYSALRTLMTDTHTYRNVVYSGTGNNSLATFWRYTDTAAGANSYLYFYADIDASSGYTMNREHIWCKSSASFYEKGGGADLHHLRPSISFVNEAKGSHAFGNVKGKYSDASATSVGSTEVCWVSNSSNLFEVRDNIKGDVARILLYVYCRWAQPNLYTDVEGAKLPAMDSDDELNFGEKVVENLDVLLQWMQTDPVDEWEMARNDQTENIQGNRNVFIDYPELAWLMFGMEVPADMATPSGKAIYETHSWDNGVQTAAPSCTETGMLTYTCTDCGKTRSVVLPATGHQYANGICDICGEAGTSSRFVLTNALTDGAEVILYFPYDSKALSCVIYNTNYRCGETVSVQGDEIYTDSANIIWTVEQTEGGYNLRGADGRLLAASASNYYLNHSGTDTVWNVNAAKTANCMYLKSSTGKYVEWVARYNDFGAYGYSASYESQLVMQVYTKVVDAVQECPSKDYADVPAEGNWAHEGIDYVIEHGIMGSTKTDTLLFEPNTYCTRAMIVSMLYSLAGKPAVAFEGRFSDVAPGQWYSKAVIWAYRNKVVSGYNDGCFGPNDYVTREQMAVILQSYAENVEGAATDARANLSEFPDENKATWSREAMRWAVAVGLISGKSSNGQKYLDPQGKASRAEAACILMKFMQEIVN